MDIKDVFNEESLHSLLDGQVESFLREEAKQKFAIWLHEKALPTMTDIAGEYIARLQEDAENEAGWCKFRDQVFLPLTIQGGLWLAANALDKIIKAS